MSQTPSSWKHYNPFTSYNNTQLRCKRRGATKRAKDKVEKATDNDNNHNLMIRKTDLKINVGNGEDVKDFCKKQWKRHHDPHMMQKYV